MATIEHSESGLPAPPTGPGAHTVVLAEVSSGAPLPTTPIPSSDGSMLPTSAMSTCAKRTSRWALRRSDSSGVPNARHRVTLPANTPMSKRPMPEFNPIWAVRGDGENDFCENLHIEEKKLNLANSRRTAKIFWMTGTQC